MPFSLLPFLLLAVPIVEIAVFIAVGDQIGIFYTLLMIFVTAVLGSILLRIEGFKVLNKIRTEMSAGRMPARELTSGVMILIAGVLLLTPGFITDTIGFLLFLPPVRAAIRTFLASRIKMSNLGDTAEFKDRPFDDMVRPQQDDEGPVVDLDEKSWSRAPDPSSPWNTEPTGNTDEPGKLRKR